MKYYGHLSYEPKGRAWKIGAEPHVIIRIKRVFPRISTMEFGEVTIAHSGEVAQDLHWFITRYPMKMTEKDRSFLRRQGKAHKTEIATLEELVGGVYQPRKFKLAVPARHYQRLGADLYLRKGSLLLADDLGLGKTVTAIASFMDKRTLPAVVVSLAGTMPAQWERMINRFAPDLFTHVIEKRDPYRLPKRDGRTPDVLIITYYKLPSWQQILAAYGSSVVFDECQELRRTGSCKYDAAREVARHVQFRFGLSATPIYNYGGEIFNVLDVLSEGILGPRDEFTREWCSDNGRHSTLRSPKAFGSWMADNHVMLRRTRRDVGAELPPLTRIPHFVDYDIDALDKVQDKASELARIILDRDRAELYRGERMHAAEELSNTLRQATGIAKARHVAEFLRLLLESGERVLVYAWHRAVYDILGERLKEYHPVFYTGHESVAQKTTSLNAFMNRRANLLFMSLRAGAGIDGLQEVCRTVVFAELDWSSGVHEQDIGRIFRDGQKDPVSAYFVVSEGGSDPIVAERLGLKQEQVDGIRDPKGTNEMPGLLEADARKTADLATHYLEQIKGKKGRKRNSLETAKC